MLETLTNTPSLIIGLMLVLHLISDFYLQIQSNLHKFKSKRYWNDQIDIIKHTVNDELKELTDKTILERSGDVVTAVKISKTDKEKIGRLRDIYDDAMQKAGDRLSHRYCYDYLAGMVCHCLLWSLLTFAPLGVWCNNVRWWSIMGVNLVIHAAVDDAKCNHLAINLVTDQLLHLVQILVTFFIVYSWI